MDTNMVDGSQPGFPIGVVCRLTGVAQETLRAWERRYGLVKPDRAGGRNRLYSRDEIRRIALVKALVDAGHAVGSIAALDDRQLEALKEATGSPVREPVVAAEAVAAVGAAPVVVVGQALAARVLREPRPPGLEGAVGVAAPEALREGQAVGGVLVIDMPTLHPGAADVVARLMSRAGALGAVVVHAFAAREAMAAVEALGVVCIRGPVEPVALGRACASVVEAGAVPAREGLAAGGVRRFTPEQLAAIVALRPSIACECPRHLADLISSLVAFERYSGECEHRSPADAHIHRELQRMAAAARGLVEAGLERVLAFEGVVLEGR
jgi:DNA-binding transcriptional MerR regulator